MGQRGAYDKRMGDRNNVPRCRLKGFQPLRHALPQLHHRFTAMRCRGRVIEPGLERLGLRCLQVIDGDALPLSEVAIAQRRHDFNLIAKQGGRLPGAQLRSAE